MARAPLEAILRAEIRAGGPLTLAKYTALCLTHPLYGYYMRANPPGRAGDFVTAPEISQMFGELIGLFLADVWQGEGAPSPFLLAELGPGRGTLMADLLRATRALPGFQEAARIALVECSPALRAAQEKTLSGKGAQWFPQIEALPDLPLFLVANEFFDALPMRQFAFRDGAWREIMVGLDANGALSPCIGAAVAAPLAARMGAEAEEGALFAFSSLSQRIAREIGRRLQARSGVALIIDYGYQKKEREEGVANLALLGVRRHDYASPWTSPGRIDLSAHVDFSALEETAKEAGATVDCLESQGAFLARLGLRLRAERLASSHPAHRGEIMDGADRLLAPHRMGRLFRALALRGKSGRRNGQ